MEFIFRLFFLYVSGNYFQTIFLYNEEGGFIRRMLAYRYILRKLKFFPSSVEEDWEDMALFIETCGPLFGVNMRIYRPRISWWVFLSTRIFGRAQIRGWLGTGVHLWSTQIIIYKCMYIWCADRMSKDKMSTDKMSTDKMPNRQNVDKIFFFVFQFFFS